MGERKSTGWSPSGMNYPSGYKHPVENDRTREIALNVKGELSNCWCGEEVNHDWPDKADGAPHPRKS